MKKIRIAIVALLVLSVGVLPAVAVGGAESGEGVNTIRKFTPVIDGVIDDEYLSSYHIDHKWPEERTPENYWASGKYKFETLKDDSGHEVIVGGKPIYTGECGYNWDAQASSYFLWDDDNIYIAVEVTDDDYGCIDDEHYKIALDNPNKYEYGPFLQDSVNIKISFGDYLFSVFALRDGRAIYSYPHIGTEDVPYDICKWSDYASGEVTDISRYGAVVSEDGGYIVELCIPIKEDAKEEILRSGKDFGYCISLVDAAENSRYLPPEYPSTLTEESCFLSDFVSLTAEFDFDNKTPTLLLTLSDEAAVAMPPYDLTADGVFDTKDLTRLMRYIAGDATATVAQSADINGDGAVNVKDLTRMMKLLAAV